MPACDTGSAGDGTGIFDDSRYFDVRAEYAKESEDDILIRLTIFNRGPAAAAIHLLPTLWFRNTWSWGASLPSMRGNERRILAEHPDLGTYELVADHVTPPS